MRFLHLVEMMTPQTQADPRFAGIARLYGQAAVDYFARAHVAVIGLGGVGSWVVEALARSGVGALTLVDLDEICVSNTNRQLHTLSDTIGRSKVEVMAARVQAINPACQIQSIEDFASVDNLDALLGQGAPLSLLVDAIDSVAVKAALIAWCGRRRLPVITMGGAGGRLDPLAVQVGDLSATFGDPLASKVRYQLRRQHGYPRGEGQKFNVPCVFSAEPLRYAQTDGSVCNTKPDAGNGPVRLDCASGFGAAMPVTATFGMITASLALKQLAKLAAKALPQS